MQLHYEITEQDYIDLNVHHFENSRTMRRAHNKARFSAPVLFLSLPFVLKDVTSIPFWYWMSLFGITAVLWLIFYTNWTKKYYIRQTKRMLLEGNNSSFLGSKTLTLTENGIVTKGEGDETTTSYSSISQISEGRSAIYLYNSAISAIMVPYRAFSSKEQQEEFLQEIRTRVPSRGAASSPSKKSIFRTMDRL